MSTGIRYTDEFKRDSVAQFTDRGYSVKEVAERFDNALAESFFHLLKRERIRRRTYTTRKQARQDVFDYIKFFYNPKRKHGNNGLLSPVDFEQ